MPFPIDLAHLGAVGHEGAAGDTLDEDIHLCVLKLVENPAHLL